MTAAPPSVDSIPQNICCSNSSPLDITLSRRPQHEDSMLTIEEDLDFLQDDPFLGWNATMRRAQDPTESKANACWDTACNTTEQKGFTRSLSGNKRQRIERHSQKLSAMLKADLRLSDHNNMESATSKMKHRNSLKEFQPDIDILLTSLKSTEFVGKIDPKYHSRYTSAHGF
jgi:hypothetical protein